MTILDGLFASGAVSEEAPVRWASLCGRPQPSEAVSLKASGGRVLLRIPGRELAFWTLHLGFWAVVFCLLQLKVAVYQPQFSESLPVLGARVGACLVVTAAMRRLAMLPRLLGRLNVTRAGLVAGGLLTSAVGITLGFGVVDGVFTGAAGGMPRSRLTVDLADNATLLASWCAVYFGFQLIQERSTAQFRAVEAEAAGHGRSTGTGLESLARRLELLVGPMARLEHGEHNGMVRVRVWIPIAADPRGQPAC